MKNYMDKFKTPEEYIRFVVLSEHPAQEGDFKKAMADLAAMSENGHRGCEKKPLKKKMALKQKSLGVIPFFGIIMV